MEAAIAVSGYLSCEEVVLVRMSYYSVEAGVADVGL